MIQKIPIYVVILTVFLALSCKTVTYKVIERSKKEEPTWVADLGSDAINPYRKGFRVYFKKTNIQDLPLGIRQGQQQALSHAYRKALNLILQNANVNMSALNGNDQKVVQNSGMRVLEGRIEPNSLIKDIYFEKLSYPSGSGLEDSYTIYILCYIGKEDIDQATKAIKKLLLKSGSPQLRAFGEGLRESVL